MAKQQIFKKFISLFVAVIMAASMLCVQTNIMYAASLSAPEVTLSNASSTSVKVKWTKVNSASKYTVYRSTKKSSGYKALKTVTSTSYTDKKLKCGKTYYYKVKAIKNSKSKTSSAKKIKAVPAAVSSFKTSAACSYIKISWKKSSDVSGYQIYYSTSKNGSYKKLKTLTSSSYKHTKLSLSTVRYYKVRAYKKVGGSTVYGSFTSPSGKKTAHSPSSSWTVVTKATCNKTGKKSNVCKYCSKTYYETIEKDNTSHQFERKTVAADNVNEAYTVSVCKNCGKELTSDIKQHKYTAVVTAPTCGAQGYTTYTCTRSDCEYSYVGDYVDATGEHQYETKTVDVTCVSDGYTVDVCTVCGAESEKRDIVSSGDYGSHLYGDGVTTEEGYIEYTCERCSHVKTDTTCYIDLTNRTVSVPGAAQFGFSSSNTSGIYDKLDLNTDGVSDYEITGSTENLTIDVNASCDVEVRLAGVTIVNDSEDCIDIKNKADKTDETDSTADETGTATEEKTVPEVTVTAVASTVNTLSVIKGSDTSTGTGNAIDSSCKVQLKGHGTLELNTAVSTSFTSSAKISIKNITLNINSSNRGIDTKYEETTKSETGEDVLTTTYYNIKLGSGACITINSQDDCIRCKNFEISAVETTTDGEEQDIPSVLTLTSVSGDGIQIEGKTGFVAYSGTVKINAGKYAFNCSSDLVINSGATIEAKGAKGICKA